MRILVACEESQAVCTALRYQGHEAYSCDIIPCSGGHPEWHLQQDVTPLLSEKWDMIIAFPPCTHLCLSGARFWKQKQADGRQQAGLDFFMLFTNLTCPLVAIENPVGIMSRLYRKPDQIIQPWQFGHPETKSTCLWLKGLPKLQPTNIVIPEYIYARNGKRYSPAHWNNPSGGNPERSKLRSKTYKGIAEAMVTQWCAAE